MIDKNARDRLYREIAQKQLIASIVDKVKPPPPPKIPDYTEVLTETQKTAKNSNTLNYYTLGSLQKLNKSMQDVSKNGEDLKSQVSLTKDLVSAVNNVDKKLEETNKMLEKVPEADPRVIGFQDKLGKAIATLYKLVDKPIEWPKLFNISGRVKVSEIEKMPDITVSNLSELKAYFQSLEERIGKLSTAISSIKPSKIEIPKFDIPKIDNGLAFSKLEKAMGRIEDAIVELSQKEPEFPEAINIANFPPQMTPQPVTHISLNAIQGFVKTTSATVGTSLVALPTYGVLDDRRSILVFNNSSNTIYMGGSDVTTSNGIPVLTQSFSPIFDAGVNTIVYAIASTSNNNVRVMEVSDEDSGR